MTDQTHCPHCAVDLRVPVLSRVDDAGRIYVGGVDMAGRPITTAGVHVHDEHGQPLYGSNKISMEVPGVYDGHLFWMCPFCNDTWHNWPRGHRLRAAAERHMEAARAQRSHSDEAEPRAGTPRGDALPGQRQQR